MNKIARVCIFALLLISCKDETSTPAQEGFNEIFDWGPNEDTYALATYGATVFVSTSEGLYRSDDNGRTWQEITNPLEEQFSDGPGVLLGSNARVFGTGNSALYSSLDFGITWGKQATFTAEFGTITSMASNATYLFAGTNNGQLFRSTDLGVSWVNVLNGGQAGDIVRSIATDGNTIFVFIKGRGLRISTDQGGSWLDVSGSLGPFDDGAIAIAENTLFTVAHGLYRSSNGGETWTPCDVFLDEKSVAIGYDLGAAITSVVGAKGIPYAVAGHDLFYSKDAGASFHKIPSKEKIVNGAFRLFANTFFVFGLDQHRLCSVGLVKP